MYSIKVRLKMLIPFLRPSKEKTRDKLSEFLKSAICQIRIANPIAQEAAEKLAHLFLELMDASEIDVERIEMVLKMLVDEDLEVKGLSIMD